MNLYLASPYSHEKKEVEEVRYEANLHVASQLFRLGHIVYSPIVAWHEAAKRHRLPTGYGAYQELNKFFIEQMQEFWVLDLAGWEKSIGVQAETNYAIFLFKPVRYFTCLDVSLAVTNWDTEWLPKLKRSKEE